MIQQITLEEINVFRSETPGTDNCIHFNNAGASLIPLPVYKGMESYLKDELLLGGYETQVKWQEALNHVYTQISNLIHAEPSEIALVESATIAWYKAFHSLKLKAGDVVLTCESEYGSNFIGFLQASEELGVDIRVIPSDETGTLSLPDLEAMIDQRVKLIAITHMPTNGGLVNPAEEVGEIAYKHSIPYLLDACQSVGQYPINVNKIKCTFLSATGRKYMRAPRGTGFLYVNKDWITRLGMVFPDLTSAEWVEAGKYIPRGSARRFENFESNRGGLIGLGMAAEYIQRIGIERIWLRNVLLAAELRTRLSLVPGVRVTDQGKIKSAIVTFSVDYIPSIEIKEYLISRRVHVSVSQAGSTRIDMDKRGLNSLVRASVHYYNTAEELTYLIEALQACISYHRKGKNH
ncbi:MAG: aminotransferase class V-fold PLP-dependent enzyme [Bacteroidota bacterium]